MVFSVQMLARKGEKQYKVRRAGGKWLMFRLSPTLACELRVFVTTQVD